MKNYMSSKFGLEYTHLVDEAYSLIKHNLYKKTSLLQLDYDLEILDELYFRLRSNIYDATNRVKHSDTHHLEFNSALEEIALGWKRAVAASELCEEHIQYPEEAIPRYITSTDLKAAFESDFTRAIPAKVDTMDIANISAHCEAILRDACYKAKQHMVLCSMLIADVGYNQNNKKYQHLLSAMRAIYTDIQNNAMVLSMLENKNSASLAFRQDLFRSRLASLRRTLEQHGLQHKDGEQLRAYLFTKVF